MEKLHSPHPAIKNKTRCGLSKENVWSTNDNGRVTCERCLVNLNWEQGKGDKPNARN